MTLPNGFYPVEHTFGMDDYNSTTGNGSRMWNDDDPSGPTWPVFVEGVIKPVSQAPWSWAVTGGLIDSFPRTAYYGGPIQRQWAQTYVRLFQNWAASMGYAYETAIIPIHPNMPGNAPWPRTNFAWYIAQNEQRPPTRYRFLRVIGDPLFRWYDQGFDSLKYANFHAQNPNAV